MSNVIPLSSTSQFSFNRGISEERLKKIISTEDKATATHMGVWDKIKEWVCGTNKQQVLDVLFDLIHAKNYETAFLKFNALKSFVNQDHQLKFEIADIVEQKKHVFKIDKTEIVAIPAVCSSFSDDVLLFPGYGKTISEHFKKRENPESQSLRNFCEKIFNNEATNEDELKQACRLAGNGLEKIIMNNQKKGIGYKYCLSDIVTYDHKVSTNVDGSKTIKFDMHLRPTTSADVTQDQLDRDAWKSIITESINSHDEALGLSTISEYPETQKSERSKSYTIADSAYVSFTMNISSQGEISVASDFHYKEIMTEYNPGLSNSIRA